VSGKPERAIPHRSQSGSVAESSVPTTVADSNVVQLLANRSAASCGEPVAEVGK